MTERAPILEVLGEVEPLLREYQQVCDSAPAEPHFVEFYDRIKADKKSEGKHIPATEHALTDAGFAHDSVRHLLAQCVSYESESINEIKAEDLELINVLQKVPTDLRKRVRIVNDGYYFAGVFHPIKS